MHITIYMKNYPKKQYSAEQKNIAAIAKALAHPARISILQYLASQKNCYFSEIQEELPIAQATVSQHLKELKNAGLINGIIQTPKVKYCLNQKNWNNAQILFGTLFNPKNDNTK